MLLYIPLPFRALPLGGLPGRLTFWASRRLDQAGFEMAKQRSEIESHNVALVTAGFEKWKNGTGGVFELLAPAAQWTIVGHSVASKTYRSKQEFMEQVILPFNARMSKPLVPTIRASTPTTTW
jgi:uncharacterized protein